MLLLLGALTIGLIMSLLTLGVFISFRIFDVADITADGSITFGAAITAVLLVAGWNPVLATACGFLGGLLAGVCTGILQTFFRINSLLSGILVMTALYSVNLHVMGKSNVSLLSSPTLANWCASWGQSLFGAEEVLVWGWLVGTRDIIMLGFTAFLVFGVALLLYAFFRTQVGTAMRASGDNPQMARALGVNVESYRVWGLALSNGLVGLSGALMAQYQAFADAQMGIGMVVYGLAAVIIGEALTATRSLGFAIIGAIMGSVLFRLMIALALRWGLNPNDLKLITALFVFAALVLPTILARLKRKALHA